MKNLLLSVTCALLLSAGWLSVSGLPLVVALVPLLVISGGYGPGRRNFWKTLGWTALALGLWSAATTWWIWNAAPIGAILSVAITVTLFGALFMLYHYVSKRAPAPLAFTLLVAGWIACEMLYTVGELSFPWLVLGNGFAGDIKLVQWYDTTGVFGGSLWVLLCNILIYSTIVARRGMAWIVPAVVFFLPAAISLAKYHTYEETGEPLTVTLVQPNLDPYREKFTLSQREQTDLLLGMAAGAPADVDFVLMPETALDDNLREDALDDHPTLDRFRELIGEQFPAATIVLGATTFRVYGPGEEPSPTARTMWDMTYDVFNSAVILDSSHNTEVYHKSELVVGVERMPYYTFLKRFEFFEDLIVDLGGISGQLGAGWGGDVFTDTANGRPYSVAICWDAVYGETMSAFARGGARVFFIISNDGWWGDTRGYRQLFLYSRLRAVENRRAVARSANTGISGFIDARGDIVSQTGWDERAVLTGTVSTGDRITFYVRWGDYIGRISVYVFTLCALCFVAFAVKRRDRMN